jgi:hypothetical protein
MRSASHHHHFLILTDPVTDLSCQRDCDCQSRPTRTPAQCSGTDHPRESCFDTRFVPGGVPVEDSIFASAPQEREGANAECTITAGSQPQRCTRLCRRSAPIDARFLFAMLRRHRPSRVLCPCSAPAIDGRRWGCSSVSIEIHSGVWGLNKNLLEEIDSRANIE